MDDDESANERVTQSRCVGLLTAVTSLHPVARDGAAGVLAPWPGDASCPCSAALGHREAGGDPSPSLRGKRQSLGRQPWGLSQRSPPPPAHLGAVGAALPHLWQTGARADKLPSGSLGRVECRLELELHLPLPPGGEKGPVDRVVHHSYTACLHLGASSRKPSQIGPLASSSLVAICTRDIPMVAAGPWLCFWSQEVTAAQGLGRFSLGHKTRCVGSGEVCHLPVL